MYNKDSKRKYYIKNKERILSWSREHYNKVKNNTDRKIRVKKYLKQYRELNREYLLEYQKKWNDNVKNIVYSHYRNRCECCGETNIFFLTIDHVNNDAKKQNTTGGSKIAGANLYNTIIKEGFPDKYRLLCFNCNCGRYRNNNICPHILATAK